MRNTNRKFKNENKIKAVIKAYTVNTRKEIAVGKLNKRGEGSKLIAKVNVKKTIPAGQRLDLRIAYKKFDGNTLVYCHGFGWTEVKDLNDAFVSTKGLEIKDDVYDLEFAALTTEKKLELILNNFPEEIANLELTKTEKLTLAYLRGEDLKEATKEIGIDKSTQYKLKKHPEQYEEKFVKKMELKLA